ncbi:hypothetical protein BXZ70DRAFT_696693, partial [Cristinia sonorae]
MARVELLLLLGFLWLKPIAAYLPYHSPSLADITSVGSSNMDVVEAIRQDLGFIEVHGQPAVESAIKELRGKLGRALKRLSDELYSKATHFLLEFIQNADDNKYPPDRVPTLRITLEPEWLVIECNEEGFEASNVKALCNIGASTKENKEGYIGEKGIGFKAVFKVADVVYVLSRDYSFFFDKSRELGMIAPTWSNTYPVRPGWTTFRLKLSSADTVRQMSTHLLQIRPALLLFLRRLRQIEVNTGALTGPVSFCRTQNDKDIILERVSQGTSKAQKYLVVEHKLPINTYEPKRSGIEQSQITLAFPLTMQDEPVIEDQSVYAFLPLRDYGFKFIIHGDFLTPSSREDILNDLPWNICLRDGIPKAFVQAIGEFHQRPNLRFRWFRFIPKGVSDSFMWPVQYSLMGVLEQEPIILCSDDVYRPPCQVLLEPFADADAQPLIPPLALPDHCSYISSGYDVSVDISILLELGVRRMSWEHFLSSLSTMQSLGILGEQTDEWHESVCDYLLDISGSGLEQLRSLPIIPLADGSWKSSRFFPVYFSPSSLAVPLDLGVYFVQPLERQSARYRLFQRLGISEADPQSIARRIVQIHSSATVPAQRASLVAHVKFLFDHRQQLEPLLSSGISLWVHSNSNTVARATDLYMDSPRYSEDLSLSQFLDAPFIAEEYMAMYPAGSGDFKPWCNWLQSMLGIRTTPVDASGSLAFSILQSVQDTKLLRILKEYWPEMKKTILSSPVALAELRSREVTCMDGSRERLDATFLKTKELSKYGYLAFLPVENPDSPDWEFLEHLGVSLKYGGASTLKRLIRLSRVPMASRTEVVAIYKELEARLSDDLDPKTIRDAFKYQKLIYATWDAHQIWANWLSLSDVVWMAPLSVQTKCRLYWQYPDLQSFFFSIGVPSECPPSVLLDEVKPISAEWRGKTIPEHVYKRVSSILIDINRVVSLASQQSSSVSMSWLRDLRDQAIFPVKSPSLGLTLLSARDTFYIPDQSGN